MQTVVFGMILSLGLEVISKLTKIFLNVSKIPKLIGENKNVPIDLTGLWRKF